MSFYSLDLSNVHNGAQSMRVSTKQQDKKQITKLIHKGFYPTKGDEYTLSFIKSREGTVEMNSIKTQLTTKNIYY